MKPYNYQENGLDSIESERKLGKKEAFVVMACGLGKTALVAFDAKWFMTNKDQKLLYLCNQNKTLYQAETTFREITGENENQFGFLNGVEKNIEARYLFASFQTMKENLKKFKRREFDYVVIDEAHHSPAETYQPIVEYFKPKFKIGLTATPERMDFKNILDLFGGKNTFELNIEKALALGLLPKINYKLIDLEVEDLETIIMDSRATLKDLDKRIFRPRRDEKIAEIIAEKINSHGIKDPRTVIFCNSIKHAELFSLLVPDSMAIHSKLSNKEQEKRIKMFRQGTLKTILTVDQFNEGVDIPEMNVVVFLRSTASSIIFYQQLGRVTRPYPEKESVLVLDFVANCQRIEMINELIQKIQGIKSELKKTESKVNLQEKEDEIIIDFGRFDFFEMAKEVSEILRVIRVGYTQEELIKQLQNLAEEIGGTPTSVDIYRSSKVGKTASDHVFTKTFGSLNKAREAAGLKLNKTENYSKDALIKQLQNLAKRIGTTPSSPDIVRYSKQKVIADISVYFRHFGTLEEAWKIAGLEKVTRKGYSKSYLLGQLQVFTEELGHEPSTRDFDEASKKGLYPSSTAFKTAFGSLNKAKEILLEERQDSLIQKYVIKLKEFYENKTKIFEEPKIEVAPSEKEILPKKITRWKMKKEDISRIDIKNIKESMLSSLSNLCSVLKRKPDILDLNTAAREGVISIPNYEAYKIMFGGLDIALSLLENK